MKDLKISQKVARRLALQRQLLWNGSDYKSGVSGAAKVIEHLGYIQIDTIAVLERAHHHTWWTRFDAFKPEMLDELLTGRRLIFEYWGHQASYLPMCDYRYYIPRMNGFNEPNSKWEKDRLKNFGHLMPEVLQRITNEGPLGSSDFAKVDKRKGGTWWDWRPYKVALELLFWRGDLMITARRKFQRIYDLTERVLPPGIDTSCPSDNELGRFLVVRALNAHGIATEKEIREHLQTASAEVIEAGLGRLVESGVVIKAKVDGNKTDYFILKETLQELPSPRGLKKVIHILSPFDNLIIQRDRLKNLFDFDYALECYTPAAKRKFGYFVLPVMMGDAFAARCDVKAERKTATLMVRKFQFEPDFKHFDEFIPRFSEKLAAFARFNGCDTVKYEKVSPARFKKPLGAAVRKAL